MKITPLSSLRRHNTLSSPNVCMCVCIVMYFCSLMYMCVYLCLFVCLYYNGEKCLLFYVCKIQLIYKIKAIIKGLNVWKYFYKFMFEKISYSFHFSSLLNILTTIALEFKYSLHSLRNIQFSFVKHLIFCFNVSFQVLIRYLENLHFISLMYT